MEQFGSRLRQMLSEMGRAPRSIERFTVKDGDRISLFHVDQIDWIEADQYYAKIHIGGEVHMIRQTMMALEELLPAGRFARIHRSTIVNLDRVVALEPLFQGDHTVVLRDGTRLKMSRRRKELLNDILRPLG
jgi:two-component system LytT family response regulator